MNSRRSLCWCACVVLALVMSANMVTVFGQEPGPPQELIDAERLAAAGDWDQAVEALTQLIQRVESGPSRRGLRTAPDHGVREDARFARLQTGDRSNATIDFTALLQIDPNYAFVAPSPGIMRFFEGTRKSTLASLELSVSPEDAVVVLEKDGALSAGNSLSAIPAPIGSSVVDSRFLSLDGPQTRL